MPWMQERQRHCGRKVKKWSNSPSSIFVMPWASHIRVLDVVLTR